MESSLIKEKINNLNSHYVHPSYSLELELVRNVAYGDYNAAMSVMRRFLLMERPQLALNPIRSEKNSLIALCTVLTRAAIKGGVYTEDAFDMSDAVIRNIETLNTMPELKKYEGEMVQIFTDLVNNITESKYEYPISKMIDYIYQNITSKITVTDLCNITHLSADYISRLFNQKVGMSITDYIQIKKVESSKSFLLYKDISITDVAAIYDFCNHGYYSKVFKKHTGYSPIEFRRLNITED